MLDKNGKLLERRRPGPDIWVRIIHWLGVCVWLLIIVVLVLTDKARPPMATFFDRTLNIQLRTTWDLGLIRVACSLMVIILSLCTIGIFINFHRHRRKDDRYNLSLIIMGILSLLGILFCSYYLRK